MFNVLQFVWPRVAIGPDSLSLTFSCLRIAKYTLEKKRFPAGTDVADIDRLSFTVSSNRGTEIN